MIKRLVTCQTLDVLLLLFSFTKSCPALCDPMDCSTPDLPILHYLLEFVQTHVHWVGHIIQSSHPLSLPSPPALNLSQHQGLSQLSQLFVSQWPCIGASVFSMNIQDWFPLGSIGLISLQSTDSQGSSPAPQFENINSLAFSLPYIPALTSLHDYWENYNFDHTDLGWQSDIFFLIYCLGLL